MSIEQLCVNTIRFLAVDAVQKANSGHPGMPMGAADYAFVLWTRFLRFNPQDPDWIDRDRFILSAGHGSMLLYSLLHLSGYSLDLEQLKQFRQLHSTTPGHPEYGLAPGVETTTGPLGQGFGNGVGLALAGKMLAARLNGESAFPISYRVFGIVSDGDLMEGVAAEAASLAGHLGLGNLNYIYDDNQITIDGKSSLSFSEDVAKRFDAYGWHTQTIDAHDHDEIGSALEAAIAAGDRPSLVIAKSHIGFGSPNKQDHQSSHGAPLGEDEVRLTKQNLGWPADPPFHIPDEVRDFFNRAALEKRQAYDQWHAELGKWQKDHAEKTALWRRLFDDKLVDDLAQSLLAAAGSESGATRSHSSAILQTAAQHIPALCGGSADLAASVLTTLKESPDVARGQFDGRNLHFGIREHAMAAMANGMALSGAFIPYVGTFLVFSDYMRPSVRLAALMGLRVIFVFSHDSIFLGEDGPTHQPIEQLAALRLIPNLMVLRPADAAETALSWSAAISRGDGPSALILTRQKLQALEPDQPCDSARFSQGGYVVHEGSGGRPDITLIATGSEVALAVAVRAELEKSGRATRVVSVPCETLLRRQTAAFRDRLFGEGAKRVVIEAGVVRGWYELVGPEGLYIGMADFGASAPHQDLARHFGFDVAGVMKRISERGWIDASETTSS